MFGKLFMPAGNPGEIKKKKQRKKQKNAAHTDGSRHCQHLQEVTRETFHTEPNKARPLGLG